MAHELPKLPYDYAALEPVIDAQTMELHHSKHHQAYVDKLNAALQGHDDLAAKPIEDLLRGIKDVPEDIRTAVTNHGGGHANHAFFWEIMAPAGQGGEPSDALIQAVATSFGSLEDFKATFSELAVGIFGSGWAWLVKDGEGKLQLYAKPLQNSPYMDNHTPILGLDVWEHAYYLKYQNRRKEYVDAWWQLVNWQSVSQRFSK